MRLRHRLLAWRDLLGLYAHVFRQSWNNRHALRSDFFNRQEAAFLPASLSLQETPDSSSLRWTARILMALVVLALLWAVLGRMDIVVNAVGKVIPSGRTKIIASIDVASVRAIHVTEGQQVRAGDLLVELDSSSSDAEHDKAVDALAQARLLVARSQAMSDAMRHLRAPQLAAVDDVTPSQWQSGREQLDGQYRDFHARLARLDGQIVHYETTLPLVSRRAADFKALLADHTVAYHAWLEQEQARVSLAGQLEDVRNQRTALIAQTRKEAHDAMTEGNKIIAAAIQDRRRAGQHSKLLRLTAPVDGTVQQLEVFTVGGVVPAAQTLMQIVPQDSVVEIEAFLENKDVGFVQAGQSAEVKIDAFDYTRYGTVSARVRHVSQDAIQDERQGLIYSSRIAPDRNSIVVDGKNLPLSAGMSVKVEIKTGTRRIIEYVLAPFITHQREALHER